MGLPAMRDLPRMIRARNSSLEDLVRAYVGYAGFIGHGLKNAFFGRVNDLLAEAGRSVQRHEVLGPGDELTRGFLRSCVPELEDAYFARDSSGLFGRVLFNASANEHFSTMFPDVIGRRMMRPERPALHLIRHDAMNLFVAPQIHQGFDAARGIYVPELSSRAVARPLIPDRQSSADRPVVIARDHFQGDNFSHFLFDMVPRILHLARADPKVAAEALFVLGGNASAMQRLIVDLFGETMAIERQRFLEPDQPMVLSCPRGLYGFSDQLDPGHPAMLGHAETLAMIRAFLARIPLKGSDVKRLYISRKDAAVRRLENEDAVVERLETMGFRSVRLGEMPLSEQMEVVAGADVIVAPHGMGLTHILFHRGRPKILELFNPEIGTDAYAMIARAMGFQYEFMLGHETNPRSRDFAVDPDAVGEKVRSMTGPGV